MFWLELKAAIEVISLVITFIIGAIIIFICWKDNRR